MYLNHMQPYQRNELETQVRALMMFLIRLDAIYSANHHWIFWFPVRVFNQFEPVVLHKKKYSVWYNLLLNYQLFIEYDA